MTKVDELIALNQQQATLLQELKTALEVEKYEYFIDSQNGLYYLVRTEGREVLKTETKLSVIKSWLRIRNITNYIEL